MALEACKQPLSRNNVTSTSNASVLQNLWVYTHTSSTSVAQVCTLTAEMQGEIHQPPKRAHSFCNADKTSDHV